MGLILSGATPVYVMPEYSTKWQMWGGVTPETIEKAFAETPDAKAVLLVSPTYYGLCSDLQAIAEICHCHNAALLVDEAHGSHLYFFRTASSRRTGKWCGCLRAEYPQNGGFLYTELLLITRFWPSR